jgi:hypothetical protein
MSKDSSILTRDRLLEEMKSDYEKYIACVQGQDDRGNILSKDQSVQFWAYTIGHKELFIDFFNLLYHITRYDLENRMRNNDESYLFYEKKLQSLIEVQIFLLFEIRQKIITPIKNRKSYAEEAAIVLTLHEKLKSISSIDYLRKLIEEEGLLHGEKVDDLYLRLHEIYTWIDNWVKECKLENLIELGSELKKRKTKYHSNRILDREYFCLMYWNDLRELYKQEKKHEEKIREKKKKEEKTFQKFVFETFKEVGIDLIYLDKDQEIANYEDFGNWYRKSLKLKDKMPSPIKSTPLFF